MPPTVRKPPLALWLFERDMSIRDGAHYFDTTPETLRRAVLPFGHANFRPPYPGLMRRIIVLTDGTLQPNGWYPASESAAA